MKEPPDKYRTVKCPLKLIIKNQLDTTAFLDVVLRTHKLTIHVYQLLRLWLLQLYNYGEDDKLPTIIEDTIKMAFKVLSPDSAGPKPKGDNLKIYNELKQLYDEEYKQLNYSTKIDAVNLSSIIGYSTTDIVTNIENNIKLNFIKYINRFVNSMFKVEHNEILNKLKGKEKCSKRKELKKNYILLNKIF